MIQRSFGIAAFTLVLVACGAVQPGSTPTTVTPPVAAVIPTAAPTSARAPTAAPPPTSMPAPTAEPTGKSAPELVGGGAWINSEPLTLASLRGKIVLIDFWTYGCYNCTNTLPYIKQWWSTYKDQGLVIIGVHTPEFSSERVLENVQAAVKEQGITWPVVQDNDNAIWHAYENHYWPRFFLIDHRGQIIYDHIGEGAYAQTEQQIATALAAAK